MSIRVSWAKMRVDNNTPKVFFILFLYTLEIEKGVDSKNRFINFVIK